ncbi:hypothetical protein JG687_00016067, partial [Phytophthora cactorum]
MLRDSATVLWRTNCSSVALDVTREYYLQFQHGYNSTDTDRCTVIDQFMASVFRPDIVCRDFQGIRAFMDQWEKYTTFHQGLEIKLQTMRIVDSDDDPLCTVTVHANAEMTVTFTEDTVKVLYPALFNRSLHNPQEREIVANLVGSSGSLPVELVLNFDQQGDESTSFLTAFSQIDPHGSTGQIHVKAEPTGGYMNWQLEYLDVPDNIMDFEVLLFSTSANGGAECKAIE